MQFERFGIQEELPPGYRLATVDEVVDEQYGYGCNIRSGTNMAIDFDDHYFDYPAANSESKSRTRLKNGFVDDNLSLAWKEFAGRTTQKLAVAIPSDAKPPEPSKHDRVVELLYACEEDDEKEAGDLIQTFREIIRETSKGAPCHGTALHLCAREGKLKCLELILKADKDAAKTLGKLDEETALLIAALHGKGEAVKRLLHFDDTQINSETKEFQSTPLMMAVAWSRDLNVCKELLKVENIEINQADRHGNTALHLAVDPGTNVWIMKLLLEQCGCGPPQLEWDAFQSVDEELIVKSYRKNSQYNHISNSRRNFVNRKNNRQQTPLHRALAGEKIPIQFPLMLISAGADIQMTDHKGQNALHKACSLVSRTYILHILQMCFRDASEWSAYACTHDIAGKTALHTAASNGNQDAVSVLLDPKNSNAKKLVHERDYDGRTALHCAALSKAESYVQMAIVKKILEHAGDEAQLLLWATAENDVKTADTCTRHSEVKEYLQRQMETPPPDKITDKITDLLGLALEFKRHDMKVELINRGANVEDERVKHHKDLRKLLRKFRGRTSDQPSPEDLLERTAITEAIAGLLLNQNTGSPVTMGIFGGSGMGKSTLMLQVQYDLLKRAAQEGAKQLGYPRIAEAVVKKLRQFDTQLEADEDNMDEEFFLSKYREEYLSILKRLALANRKKQVPAVLAVWYNAMQYESKDEAWAGLAVQITKEMEDCMTTAQWLRICWIYSFRSKPHVIFVQLILPAALTVLLGGWIAWGAWKLLSIPTSSQLDTFKYGSLPISVIVVVWVVLTKIIGIVQPVSQQLLDYASLPSHEKKLGYQHQVINDVNFLKKEICKEPSFFWKAIASFWRKATAFLGSTENGVMESTEFLKRSPLQDNLRIVVFIDNLDRRKEKLLSPLNLILAACDINAVVTIDKAMVQDSIQREFPDKEFALTSDMVEKFLRQLIQIPIVLPDPGDLELRKNFLKELLGDPTEDSDQLKPESHVKRSESDPATQPQTVLSCCNRQVEETIICCNRLVPSRQDQNTEGGSNNESVQDFRSFDSNYSTVEIEVFQYLAKHAFGDYRSPREWKSLLNYHRLVRSIITHPSRRSTMKGWKRQLIVWVFLCWQWREQMDDIIKHWSSLVKPPKVITDVLNNRWSDRLLARSTSSGKQLLNDLRGNPDLFEQQLALRKHHNQSEKDARQRKKFWEGVDDLYPSIRSIVEAQKKEVFGNEGGASSTPETDERLKAPEIENQGKVREAGEQTSEMLETQPERMMETQEKRLQWERMLDTLEVGNYDVTMQGIQFFQEFRFSCMAGHLDLPYTDGEETLD